MRYCFITLGLFGIMCLNTGCLHHDNPLVDKKNHDPDTSAHILALASYYGEKTLHVELEALHWKSSNGSLFGACQNQEIKSSLCQQLYPLMLTYIRYQPGYENTTVTDLTAPLTWQRLHQDYQG